ncbi:MAG: PAS domain-containing sensor histidine kinase [Candidatus Saccharimonadales bacterium]
MNPPTKPTEPRAASNDRSLSEQQAEALFTSIGDGAISTDEFGRITRVNPVAQQLLGYDASELIGEWFPKKIIAVTAEDAIVSLIDRPIAKAFLTGHPISEKTYYRSKSGKTIPVSITASPILLDGKPLGAIEVFRDISLEEEVDRMKSEFISLASHQLRTPLSSIKTYSHMLVDGYMGSLSTTQKKSLQTIIRATNRMNELISTLLNITRIESGTIAITPKLVKIDTIAEEVLKELSLMAADKSTRLSLKRVGTASTRLKTDSLIVKEILTNLVVNAIKYTPEQGSVTITVAARADDVLVTVSDTGWGIPIYSQDQIFSKFFRAQNIVKRETTGTGLGLYLVKGLVDALGGRIWFKSTETTGTHFYFTLPRAKPSKGTFKV